MHRLLQSASIAALLGLGAWPPRPPSPKRKSPSASGSGLAFRPAAADLRPAGHARLRLHLDARYWGWDGAASGLLLGARGLGSASLGRPSVDAALVGLE